jgi:hypothetical protein
MSIAFVLGNGISRKNIAITTLSQCGKIYGCNALYRDYIPDVLVATDRPIATEIQESGYSAKNKFYTRRPISNLGAIEIPKPYFGFSSGPVAAGIAAMDGHRRVYLLGFDMGPTPEKLFNNLYAGTEFYRPYTAIPTYTGNWIKQLCKITQDHRLTQFFRVFGPTTADICEFDKLSNMHKLNLDTFMDRINNKKDL